MSKVYTEQPNVIPVAFEDECGTATRYVVGDSLDTVLSKFDATFGGTQESKPKAKRHRRTKQEMEAARKAEVKPKTAEEVLAKPKRKSKSLWPEQEKQEAVAA